MASYAGWVSNPPSRYEAHFQEALRRAKGENLLKLQASLRARAREFDQLKLSEKNAPELEKLQAELRRSQWKPEDYVRAFEASLQDYPAQTPRLSGLFAAPGLAAREARLFKNDFTAQLERVRAGEDFSALPADAAPDWDWLCGRHGVLRSPFVKPAPDFHDEFEKIRRQQAFLHLLTGILLERLKTGQWPVSLAEMAGFEPLPELDRKMVEYYALGDTLEVSWGEWSFKQPAPHLR